MSPIREYDSSWEGDIENKLTEKFGDKIKFTGQEIRRVYAHVERDAIFDVCKFLNDELSFEHCANVIGVDMKDYMQVVYHIDSYTTYKGECVELTVDVSNDDPHVKSVSSIWGGANWNERETWELFGIVFDGHPRLERLLTPETYEFFPFRKSYKLRGWE